MILAPRHPTPTAKELPMKLGASLRLLFIGLLFLASNCFAQTITTFDLPNSILTRPTAINAAGEITGWFNVANDQTTHAFLRHRNGNFLTFDVTAPSNENPGVPNVYTVYTHPVGINLAGEINGSYLSMSHPPELLRERGFVRRRDGTVTTFGTDEDYTAPTASNAIGQSVGYFTDDLPSPTQGFLRQHDGTLTEFDVAHTSVTHPTAINLLGDTTGSTGGMNGCGFLRDRNGLITTFNVNATEGCSPNGINFAGQITGWYQDNTAIYHGFLRQPNGRITTFDVPNSSNTVPVAIGFNGEITGYYLDAGYVYHAFIRYRDGSFTTFDVPNAIYTYPTAMNDLGQITGWYADANNIVHGFVRQ